MPTDLLPPNATPFERALDAVTARVGDVAAPIAAQLDPATCPIGDLPFLAWALSVDVWDPDWSEATKREAVAQSIAFHRVKGTRLAVDTVLARHDRLAHAVEWFEAQPPGTPHTFDVVLPLVTVDGELPDPTRSSAAFADAIVADIARVKPLREHFRFVQQLAFAGFPGVLPVARAAAFLRHDHLLVTDTSQPWGDLLQDQNGEPLTDDLGTYIDGSA